MNRTNAPTPSPAPKKEAGFVRRMFGNFWREQKEMAVSSRQKQFLKETADVVTRLRNMRVAPTRIEEFGAAVARKGLTEATLQKQFTQYKMVHISLYGIAGVLLVYALYLALNFNAYFGAGALIAAAGAAVNGYLHGYRAWQIKNRNFVLLQDAIKNIDTYLVL